MRLTFAVFSLVVLYLVEISVRIKNFSKFLLKLKNSTILQDAKYEIIADRVEVFENDKMFKLIDLRVKKIKDNK